MSLATRLSAFFLIAMAMVLAGFSGTLYLLARSYLVHELDERLLAALDTLEASVDIEPGGLEWEPADRQLTIGIERSIGAVRWAVRDGRGTPVDRSANAETVRFPVSWEPSGPGGRPAGRHDLRRPAGLAVGRPPARARRPAAPGTRPPRRRARLRGAVSRAGAGRRAVAGAGAGDAGPARVHADPAVAGSLGLSAAIVGRRLCLRA